MKLLNDLINIIYPSLCINCLKVVDGKNNVLCIDCFTDIDFISDPKCIKCSYPFEIKLDSDSFCGSCLIATPLYKAAYNLLYYNDQTSKLIHRFKYYNQSFILEELVRLLLKQINKDDIDIIIPVPIHLLKLIIRTYNQTQIIAEIIGKKISKQVYGNILIKTKYTKPQAKITRKQRLVNVKNSFSIKNAALIIGKNILLVDDVMTTGSTINECVRLLLASGAKDVFVATIARTVIK